MQKEKNSINKLYKWVLIANVLYVLLFIFIMQLYS